MKKLITLLFITLLLTACESITPGTSADQQNTKEVGNKLAYNQATPTDIEYSLERYNLIKRAYWVNGQREKAVNLSAPVTLPLGYVVLFTENSVVAQFTVEGKVSSLLNYLTPISEAYSYGGSWEIEWLADTDGTYGDNPSGIFFFTTDGKYVEWNGQYLYSDIAIFVDDPVIKISE